MTAALLSQVADDIDDPVLAELVHAIIERLRGGEQIDITDLARGNPDYATQLRDLLPTIRALADPQLAEVASDSSTPGCPTEGHWPPASLKTIGDYTLLREIGRGGMGIVFEARQVSLDRRVALKVLPTATAFDPRALVRFQRESLAAAQLDHPHIVPVYAVGVDLGVHFYAMRFIEGQSLAEIITEAAKPSAAESTLNQHALAFSTQRSSNRPEYFRCIARLGMQVAQALECAHLHGILHRDIKPGNLLVDHEGHAWITDFGLARIDAADHLTQSGDLMGTLRYMSPEQALGKRGLIDQRTDVYALGATLYELLSLQPVFTSENKAELLRKIAQDEPRSLREFDRALPAGLETIISKCLEKAPTGRYATAQELADDLRRFLAHEPIAARPPTSFEKLARWSRRHRPFVFATAATMVVTVLAALGVLYERSERTRAATALVEQSLETALLKTGSARGNSEDLDSWTAAVAAAEQATNVADAGPIPISLRHRVRRIREEVRQGEQEARQRLASRRRDQKMLEACEASRLEVANLPEGGFDWRGMADAYARAFTEFGVDLRAVSTDSATIQMRPSAIRQRLLLAVLEWRWAVRDPADPLDDKLRVIADGLASNDPPWERALVAAVGGPTDEAALAELTETVNLPRPALLTVCQLLSARGHDQNTGLQLQVLKRAHALYPDDFWTNELFGLGLLNTKGRKPADAVPYLLAAVALKPNIPKAWLALGVAAFRKGEPDEAANAFRRALELAPEYADAHNKLGAALLKRGRWDEAVAELRHAVRLKGDDAESHNNLGAALNAQHRFDEAAAALRCALNLRPDYAEARNNLATTLINQGCLVEAIAEFRKILEIRPGDCQAHNNLGVALARHGQIEAAIFEYRRALDLKPDYAEACSNLGNVLIRVGQATQAEGAYRRAVALKPGFATAHRNLGILLRSQGRIAEAEAEYRSALAGAPDSFDAHYELGRLLVTQRKWDEAIVELRRACVLRPDSLPVSRQLATVLRRKGAYGDLIEILRKLGQLGSGNPESLFSVTRQLEDAERLAGLDTRFDQFLADSAAPVDAAELVLLAGLALNPRRLPDVAARWYRQAFAADPSLGSDLRLGHRFDAACAAALASQVSSPVEIGDAERAAWRLQAREWLAAALADMQQHRDDPQLWPHLAAGLADWLNEPDLAGIRDAEQLKRIPESERSDLDSLWRTVQSEVKSLSLRNQSSLD